MFVTSDATGDIFVLAKSDLTATGDGTLVSGDRDSNAASGLRLATTDGWERAIVIALAAALPTVLLWIGWL